VSVAREPIIPPGTSVFFLEGEQRQWRRKRKKRVGGGGGGGDGVRRATGTPPS